MTKEEFENLTIKEIAEVCRKTESCHKCPFIKSKCSFLCLFIDEPQDWIWTYKEQQEKDNDQRGI